MVLRMVRWKEKGAASRVGGGAAKKKVRRAKTAAFIKFRELEWGSGRLKVRSFLGR